MLVYGDARPLEHQVEDVRRLSVHPRINVWNGLGTGKTATTAWWLQDLWWRGVIDEVVLVLPGMLKADWESTLCGMAWPEGLVDFYDLRPPDHEFIREFLTERVVPDQSRLRVLCTTYGGMRDLMTSQATKKGRFQIDEADSILIGSRGRKLATVYDEAQAAALPTSGQGIACRALSRSARAVASMTATPIGNPLTLRLWGMTSLVRPDVLRRTEVPKMAQGARPGSFIHFKTRYCVLEDPVQRKHENNGRTGTAFVPARAFPVSVHGDMVKREVLEPMSAFTANRRKEDCLDLPPKIMMRRSMQLPPKVAKMLADLVDDDRAILDSGRAIVVDNALEERLRTVELCGGWLAGEPVHDGKLCLLRDVLDELWDAHPNAQAIIWASRSRELLACSMVAGGAKPAEALRLASEAYEPGALSPIRHKYDEAVNRARLGGVGLIHGPTAERERDQLQARFKAGSLKVMVAHPGVAGAGLNWQHAKAALYYSQPLGTIARQQSEDRIHRYGLKHDALYYDLVVEGGPDEAVMFAHRRQRDVAESLVAWMRAYRSMELS